MNYVSSESHIELATTGGNRINIKLIKRLLGHPTPGMQWDIE